MQPPDHGDTWVGLTETALSVDVAARWAARPSCGAVVTFAGTARDHSDGREGVTALEYEAYDTEAVRRLHEVAGETRRRWPAVERLALLHRTGRVELTEPAVVVAASSPHRAEAFDAARFAIDTLKATVPIWKREHWAGGADWALDAAPVADVRPAAGVEA